MIETRDHDAIRIITLAHGKASALDVELCDALADALDELRGSTVRAVVLTGSGSIFSAGVDLFRLTKEGAPYVERFLPALERAIRTLFTLELPVVGAINGHAIAGGCILAQACDVRLMAQGKGRIGAPELLVGVPFPAAALEVLRFTVPRQHIQKLVYTGATLLPEEALQHGLVDELVAAEELMTRATTLARQLASLDSRSFISAKRHLRANVLSDVAEERAATLQVWSDPATHARINAYLEKTVSKK